MDIYSDGSVRDTERAKWGGSGIARLQDGWWVGKSFDSALHGVAETHFAALPFSATEQGAITSDLGLQDRRPRANHERLVTSVTRNKDLGASGATTGADGDFEDEEVGDFNANQGLSEVSAGNEEEEEITYSTATCRGHRGFTNNGWASGGRVRKSISPRKDAIASSRYPKHLRAHPPKRYWPCLAADDSPHQ
ncbi:unnamed protein product [Zymoseptoria tritici ST99CH_1A5]|uniref:RNase H type-1 domain-containing protein n=1 Tax=Zymoseptoria tritici ST99CH_1A5 TaxID=1276529 RepID=A0A1Y6LSG4_ZYMTR|nr:unnamed protein product [Zymoseptoria tritici ST99CH_1A5]